MQNKKSKLFRYSVTIIFAMLLAFTGFCLTASKSTANEGTISLSVAKKNIKKDKEFTVTLNVNSTVDMHSVAATIDYDDTMLEWIGSNSDAIAGTSGRLTLSDTYTDSVSQCSYRLTFKAKSLGQGTINITDSSINTQKDLTTILVDNATAAFTITENSRLDDDCSLEELILGCGELNPAWDSNTYEYQITVPKDTEIFAYSATPSCEDAQIISTGPDSLQDGNNTYVITVTAPSGSQQDYTLHVTR